jgi:hypothetical protein
MIWSTPDPDIETSAALVRRPHGVPGVAATGSTSTGPVVTDLMSTVMEVTMSAFPAGTATVTALHPDASLAPPILV